MSLDLYDLDEYRATSEIARRQVLMDNLKKQSVSFTNVSGTDLFAYVLMFFCQLSSDRAQLILFL